MEFRLEAFLSVLTEKRTSQVDVYIYRMAVSSCLCSGSCYKDTLWYQFVVSCHCVGWAIVEACSDMSQQWASARPQPARPQGVAHYGLMKIEMLHQITDSGDILSLINQFYEPADCLSRHMSRF